MCDPEHPQRRPRRPGPRRPPALRSSPGSDRRGRRISSRSALTSSTAAPRSRAWRSRACTSATAAKSRPMQGLAATSTSTALASSRASTTRCTLPPDSSPMRRVGRAGAHAVDARSAAGPRWRRARGESHQPRPRRRAGGRSRGRPCSRPPTSPGRRRCAAAPRAGSAPAAGASGRGCPGRAGPSPRPRPAARGRWPASTSTSSSWPLPATAATPTISPAQTSKLTSVAARARPGRPRARESWHAQAGRPRRPAGARACSDGGRPAADHHLGQGVAQLARRPACPPTAGRPGARGAAR